MSPYWFQTCNNILVGVWDMLDVGDVSHGLIAF